MKKLLAILLALVLVLCLGACGSGGSEDEPSSTDTSSGSSSEEEVAYEGGMEIPYSAVMDGYIDHNGRWEIGFMPHHNWQCMTDEVLVLPAGVSIMCNKKLAIYCYRDQGEDALVYAFDDSKKLSQNVSAIYDIQAAPCNVILDDEYIVRFSVMGKLTDVCVFVPDELKDEVRLISEADLLAEGD